LKQSRFLTVTLAAITLLALSPMNWPASTVIDWSDNFDDSNYAGWTVTNGTFAVSADSKHSLVADSDGFNMIHHPSTRVCGTWLFDLYENSSDVDNSPTVVFMSVGLSTKEMYGYSIGLMYGGQSGPSGVMLHRWNYSEYFGRCVMFDLISYNVPQSPYSGWFSYNVTRTPHGNIQVLRNGVRIITTIPETTEAEFSSVFNVSDNLVFMCTKDGTVDNIVVGENLPTTTSTTTTTPGTTTTQPMTDDYIPNLGLPLLLGGAAVVIVLLIIVRMKKR
jgi:hypothetical protein